MIWHLAFFKSKEIIPSIVCALTTKYVLVCMYTFRGLVHQSRMCDQSSDMHLHDMFTCFCCLVNFISTLYTHERMWCTYTPNLIVFIFCSCRFRHEFVARCCRPMETLIHGKSSATWQLPGNVYRWPLEIWHRCCTACFPWTFNCPQMISTGGTFSCSVCLNTHTDV